MPVLLQENGPPEFKQVVADAYVKSKNDEDLASRIVRNAGWYKTADGSWAQLTPDLREKVNIRQGIKQPDGRYLIQDVDIFYPNEVKGREFAFTPERIAEIVRNTNSAIDSGSQPPGLVREHPSADRKANGIASPAKGYGFHFRPSPRPGMTRCDIVAAPEIYEEWKKGDWIGLSAGFACDHSGTNMRFGHIALLGADMQALSRLPRVEVYSTDNQLCFSSDTGIFESKGKHMPLPALNDAQRNAMKKVAEAQKKLGDVWLSFAASEPDAQTKEDEAKKLFAAAVAELEASGIQLPEFAAEDESGEGDDEGESNSGGEGEGSPLLDEDNNTVVGEDPELDALLANEPPATTDVGGNGGGEDNSQFAAEVQTLRSELANSKKVIASLIGRQMREDFTSFMKEKQAQGHMFDSGAMMDLFSSCASQPEAVKQIRRVIENSPRDPKLVGAGQTFSAAEAGENIAQPVNRGPLPKQEVDATLSLLRKSIPHLDFSADDVQLGMIASAKP